MITMDIDRSKLFEHTMAFNNSICLFRGKRMMSYRLENRDAPSWATTAIVELDENWEPIKSTNRHINIPKPSPKTNMFEDGRLFVHRDKLHLSFIAACVYNRNHNACQGVCELDENFNPINIKYYELGDNKNQAQCGNGKMIGEKNWIFFSYKNELYILYKINPTEVYKLTDKGLERVSHYRIETSWPYGSLCGSTPLVERNGKLFGMFHSHLDHPLEQRIYYAGWYEIDPTSFRLTALSQYPILQGIRDGRDLRPENSSWKPNVVFPCGLIKHENQYIVSYGWQDSIPCLVFFNENEIEQCTQITTYYEYKERINDIWQGLPGGYWFTHNGEEIRAHNFVLLMKKAELYGVTEDQIHDEICKKIDQRFKKMEWVKVNEQ